MYKALIYTGATGAGHTLAAISLSNALTKNGNVVEVIDAFEEGGDFINRTVTKGYKQLVDHLPILYRRLYKDFDSESYSTELVLKNAARILKPDILGDIEFYDPDLIISTHPIVTNILGRLKDDKEFSVPVLAFVTDYNIHDVYLKDSIDAYVVANDYTKQSMEVRGVDPNKIYPYGIPIRKEFREVSDLKETNDKELSVLVMAGSLGSRQLKKAFINLLKVQIPLKLIVVCGNNKSLKNAVEQLAENISHTNKQIEILGFVNNISELMDECDVIITKPGGLTSTEAISKNIPIIIPYTYPGQEEQNANYLVQNGMALETTVKELASLIEYLANHKSVLTDIKENMSTNAAKFSFDKTIELCKDLAKSKKDKVSNY